MLAQSGLRWFANRSNIWVGATVSCVLGELLAHPGVVEEVRLASPVGVMALHGGIEEETAELARDVAKATDSSLYAVVQPDDLAWHIPSIHYRPDQSPALAGFLDHIDRVISIHGFGRPHLKRSILVGGANRSLAAIVAKRLRDHTDANVVDDIEAIPAGLRGKHPDNPVNAPAGGGVQLELSASVRWAPVRSAVAYAIAAAIRDVASHPLGNSR